MLTERSQFHSTLNQADLDRLLDGKCPWHKDANHTTRECRALSNGVIKNDDPKRPRRDDHDRMGGSRTTRARPRRRNSPGNMTTSRGKIPQGTSRKKTGPSTSYTVALASQHAGVSSSWTIEKSTWCLNTRLNPSGGQRR